MDHWERSNALSDSLRKLLGLINTGGIATLLATAGSLAGKGVPPKWVTLPMGVFVVALVLLAGSYFFAQHRAIRRARAVDAGVPWPKFSWWKRGLTWNLGALIAFIVGAFLAVRALSHVVLPTA